MQLKDQLKLVKYKLENVNHLHDKLSEQGGLSTIDFDLLLRNLMEVYEFYHILKMEKVLWQQSDPNVYSPQESAESEAGNNLEQPQAGDDEEADVPVADNVVLEEIIVEIEQVVLPDAEINAQKPSVETGRLSLFEDDELVSPTVSAPNISKDSGIRIQNEEIGPQYDDSPKESVEQTMAQATGSEQVEWELEDASATTMADTEKLVEEYKVVNEPSVSTYSSAFIPTEQEIDKPFSEAVSGRKSLPIESNIAINDKFIFIRELFGGDFDAYEQTIFDINNIDNRKDALDYLSNNVTDRFNWLDKEDVANDFFALVQKHFDF